MEPRIWIACLAAYNNGILHGRWFDAPTSVEEFQEQIDEVIKSSPIPGAEEWAIHDTEDLPVGEYPDMDELVRTAEFVKEHGELGIAVLDNFSGDIEAAKRALDEDYSGCYSDRADFAEQFSRDIGSEIPDWLEYYIDWDSMGRDMLMNSFYGLEVNGDLHVFLNS